MAVNDASDTLSNKLVKITEKSMKMAENTKESTVDSIKRIDKVLAKLNKYYPT